MTHRGTRVGWLAMFSLLLEVVSATAQTELEVAFPNLTFQNPVDLQNAGDGSNRLFVVDQAGRIIVFQNSHLTSQSSVFLDITDRVIHAGEMGLLGLAFHPDYEDSGYFFLNYVAPNPTRSVISRFRVSQTNPDEADSLSETVLFTVNQPYPNHNGGQLAFGPDGYLYVALGDGGSGGDPLNNGQSLTTVLGKILRIDVDYPAEGKNYGTPPDNPLAGNTSGYREEIWAYGLRNPWRFSFDSFTGQLWCGDVGQETREEIDIIEMGKNYGWNIMEGTVCYNSGTCDTTGLTFPIWDYGRDVGGSITGGYVYRGELLPELFGKYVFGDFVSGSVASLDYDGTNPPAVVSLDTLPAYHLTSFGVDENNELYLCSFDGKIYKFKSTLRTDVERAALPPQTFHLFQNFPNPFNPLTTIEFYVPLGLPFPTLKVYDQLGHEVAALLDGEQGSGTHRIVWDAAGLAGGTYYARLSLSDGKAVQTRKMLLLR